MSAEVRKPDQSIPVPDGALVEVYELGWAEMQIISVELGNSKDPHAQALARIFGLGKSTIYRELEP